MRLFLAHFSVGLSRTVPRGSAGSWFSGTPFSHFVAKRSAYFKVAVYDGSDEELSLLVICSDQLAIESTAW